MIRCLVVATLCALFAGAWLQYVFVNRPATFDQRFHFDRDF